MKKFRLIFSTSRCNYFFPNWFQGVIFHPPLFFILSLIPLFERSLLSSKILPKNPLILDVSFYLAKALNLNYFKIFDSCHIYFPRVSLISKFHSYFFNYLPFFTDIIDFMVSHQSSVRFNGVQWFHNVLLWFIQNVNKVSSSFQLLIFWRDFQISKLDPPPPF